jgi:hypothetical protein
MRYAENPENNNSKLFAILFLTGDLHILLVNSRIGIGQVKAINKIQLPGSAISMSATGIR